MFLCLLPGNTYKAVLCNVGGQSADESPVVRRRTAEKEQTDREVLWKSSSYTRSDGKVL